MSETEGTRDAVKSSVLQGLSSTPKHLPPWLFYDEVGSRLFEQITTLPEYYLTRVERGLLEQHARTIVDRVLAAPGTSVVEIGAGTATKTRVLLRAAQKRVDHVKYVPIDVSQDALDIAVRDIARELPSVEVAPICSGNVEGLQMLAAATAPRAILFLGSSIGNFGDDAAVDLLRAARAAAGDGGSLVLGADRVKPTDVLLPAYDDAAGVTEAFNKNILTRINRELGGDFDLEAFDHVAEWNAVDSCVAIYLESRRSQDVRVRDLGETFTFARGERIHTENSIKYSDARLDALLARAGFARAETYRDERAYFGLHLARAV